MSAPQYKCKIGEKFNPVQIFLREFDKNGPRKSPKKLKSFVGGLRPHLTRVLHGQREKKVIDC